MGSQAIVKRIWWAIFDKAHLWGWYRNLWYFKTPECERIRWRDFRFGHDPAVASEDGPVGADEGPASGLSRGTGSQSLADGRS